MPLVLRINGEDRPFHGDPRSPLSDALRDTYGLTGAKVVCGEGFCGACMVLVDGEPVPSCLQPVGHLEQREITTIEGVAQPHRLNALQAAFVERDVVQCGMCFPGMVLSLSHFLAHTSHPSREEVKHAMVGNACRCTGYERIIDAVLSVSDRPGDVRD